MDSSRDSGRRRVPYSWYRPRLIAALCGAILGLIGAGLSSTLALVALAVALVVICLVLVWARHRIPQAVVEPPAEKAVEPQLEAMSRQGAGFDVFIQGASDGGFSWWPGPPLMRLGAFEPAETVGDDMTEIFWYVIFKYSNVRV